MWGLHMTVFSSETLSVQFKAPLITTTSSLETHYVSQLKPTSFPPFVQINSGTLVIALQWRELIKVFWPPRVLRAALGAKIPIFLLDIFGREQWADQIARAQKRDWLQPDALCRGRGKEETRRGLESYTWGNLDFFFFNLQAFTVEHLCRPEAVRDMCFDQLQTRALHTGVCVAPLCAFRWQGWPRQLGFW